MAITVGELMVKLGVDERRLKRGLKIAGAAVAAFGVAAVKMQADFEKAMREVNTLVGATEEQFRQMSDEVVALSNKMGLSATELSQGLYQVVSAGVDAAHAMDVMTVAAKQAIAGVAGQKETVDALTTVINAWGLEVTDATRIADIFQTTIRLGKTTMTELAGTIGNVAPVAAAAGVRFDEVASAIAALTAAGIGTDRAVTGLRQVLATIIKPTEQTAEAAKKMGLDFSVAALKAKGLQGFLQDVAEATGGSVEAMAELFPNVRAIAPALALTGKAADKFAKAQENMANNSGESQKAFEEMEKSFSRRVAKIVTNLKNFAIVVGEKIIPVIEKLVEILKYTIEVLTFSKDGAYGFKDALIILAGVYATATLAASAFLKAQLAVNAAIASTATTTPGLLASLKAIGTTGASAVGFWTALGAAVAYVGYKFGELIGWATGLSNGLANLIGWISGANKEWEAVGKLTEEEIERNKRMQDGFDALAEKAQVTRQQLSEYYRDLEAGGVKGIALSLKNTEATAKYLDILDKVREKYGTLSKETLKEYIASVNAAIDAEQAHADQMDRWAKQSAEWQRNVEEAMQAIFQTPSTKEWEKELTKTLGKTIRDMRSELSKPIFEGPNKEIDELNYKIKSVRKSIYEYTVQFIKSGEKRKIAQAELNKIVDEYEAKQRKAIEAEKKSKDEDRIKRYKEEIEKLAQAEAKRTKTIQDDLAILDKEKRKLVGLAATDKERTVINELFSVKRQKIIDEEIAKQDELLQKQIKANKENAQAVEKFLSTFERTAQIGDSPAIKSLYDNFDQISKLIGKAMPEQLNRLENAFVAMADKSSQAISDKYVKMLDDLKNVDREIKELMLGAKTYDEQRQTIVKDKTLSRREKIEALKEINDVFREKLGKLKQLTTAGLITEEQAGRGRELIRAGLDPADVLKVLEKESEKEELLKKQDEIMKQSDEYLTEQNSLLKEIRDLTAQRQKELAAGEIQTDLDKFFTAFAGAIPKGGAPELPDIAEKTKEKAGEIPGQLSDVDKSLEDTTTAYGDQTSAVENLINTVQGGFETLIGTANDLTDKVKDADLNIQNMLSTLNPGNLNLAGDFM